MPSGTSSMRTRRRPFLIDAFVDDEGLVHVLPDALRRLRVLSAVVAEVVATAVADESLLVAVDTKRSTLGAGLLHRPRSVGWRARLPWLRLAAALAPVAGWKFIRSPGTAIAMGLRWVCLRRLRGSLPRRRRLARIGVRRQQRGFGFGCFLKGGGILLAASTLASRVSCSRSAPRRAACAARSASATPGGDAA